jgi:aminoglycoside/choline kinase family phosphotransferase
MIDMQATRPAQSLSTFSIIEWFESRRDLRDEFLSRCGWSNAVLRPVGEDCAFRRYFRLQQADKTAILMEAVPDGEAIATPGHRLSDFLRIGAALRAGGLVTPEIYKADAANGYLLMQDFGDRSFKRALAEGEDPEQLYRLATDVLIRLPEAGQGIALPDYYQSHVHTGRRRLVDWYMPAVTGQRLPDGLVEAYLAVWDSIERSLPPCPQGFLHIDFHVENLMLLPSHDIHSPRPPAGGGIKGGGISSAQALSVEAGPPSLTLPPKDGREGNDLRECGLLDFQGAMHGPLPYDLANLLEDARIDVPPALRAAMLERYCAGMNAEERETFLAWYRVLATQFHCRVIGQFIRLAVRDGKPRYLQFVPRVQRYIVEALRQPLLKPLAAWCAEQGIDFTSSYGYDIAAIAPLIRADAF